MLYTPGSIYDRFYRPGPKIPRGGVSLPSGGIRLPQAGARLPATIENLLQHARPGHKAMLRTMLEGVFEATAPQTLSASAATTPGSSVPLQPTVTPAAKSPVVVPTKTKTRVTASASSPASSTTSSAPSTTLPGPTPVLAITPMQQQVGMSGQRTSIFPPGAKKQIKLQQLQPSSSAPDLPNATATAAQNVSAPKPASGGLFPKLQVKLTKHIPPPLLLLLQAQKA